MPVTRPQKLLMMWQQKGQRLGMLLLMLQVGEGEGICGGVGVGWRVL